MLIVFTRPMPTSRHNKAKNVEYIYEQMNI